MDLPLPIQWDLKHDEGSELRSLVMFAVRILQIIVDNAIKYQLTVEQ
jgi:hypothetical protein